MITLIKIFVASLLFPIFIFSQSTNESENISLTSFANPFIGTSNGGNTFPGASVPIPQI